MSAKYFKHKKGKPSTLQYTMSLQAFNKRAKKVEEIFG